MTAGNVGSNILFEIRPQNAADTLNIERIMLNEGALKGFFRSQIKKNYELECAAHYHSVEMNGLVGAKSPSGFVASVVFPIEMASMPSFEPIPVAGAGYNGTSAFGISTVTVDNIYKNSVRLIINPGSYQGVQSVYVNGLVLTRYTGK